MATIGIEYYLVLDGYLYKYIGYIDKGQLKKLRNKIIDTCSKIKHHDKEEYLYQTRERIKTGKYYQKNRIIFEYSEIRNYEEQFTGKYGSDGDLTVHEKNHARYI